VPGGQHVGGATVVEQPARLLAQGGGERPVGQGGPGGRAVGRTNLRGEAVMRKTITTTVVTAAAAGSGAGIALASTHGGSANGTESFQMMSTSRTSPQTAVIAHGVFTAPGVDNEYAHNTATFVFPGGTVRVKHSGGTGQQSFNRKSCLVTVNEHGTYQLTGGTGRYAGIYGHGR